MSGYRTRDKLHIPYKEWGGRLDTSRAVAEIEKANYLAIERWANGLQLGSGKPYATLVVAASDSITPGASSADYVCTGAADETTIQQAVDVLEAGADGGRVVLLEGTYNLTAPVEIAGNQIALVGMGDGTVLDCASTTQAIDVDTVSTYTLISDLQIQNVTVGIGLDGCDFVSIRNVSILNNLNAGITCASFFSATDVDITGCRITTGVIGIIALGAETRITNCQISAQTGQGVWLQGTVSTSARRIVSSCLFHNCDEGVLITAANRCDVIGNYFHGDAGVTVGVLVQGASVRNLVLGNYFDTDVGVELQGTTATDNSIQNNYFIDGGFVCAAGVARTLFEGNTLPATVASPVTDSSATTNFGAGNYIAGTWMGYQLDPTADLATQAELDAHINDTSDAHDASAISVVPFTTIAATDVQTALQEMVNEKDAPSLKVVKKVMFG